ncbi:MAG: PKD domain-containing protein, partial [Cyclobacteriaceae bacterium]|nr:PKD domain-containing protein [Cyclobacteriaceae bacterium]
MAWKTNSQGTCEKPNRESNCFFTADGFLVRTPLVANFDFETNCDDFEVDFENLTTGGNNAAYNYTWDFAGLGSSTLANPSFTFPGAGSYDVTLTSRDGESTPKTITKTVQLFPLLEASYTKQDSDCIGDNTGSITLTVEGGKGPYTYLWSTTNGSGLVAGQKDQTGLSSGTYDVTITDDRGCFETLQIVIAQPNTAPDPTDFVDESVCENSGPLGYNITADPGYRLIFYDSETSTTPLATVPSVDTNTSGDGTFSVWASQINDDECESDRVEVKITVNPLPVLMITDPAPVCEPGTVDLTAAAVTSGSSGFNSLGYFSDADANSELTDP